MRNLLNKARNFGAAMIDRAQTAVYRTQTALACNKGEGFVDTAVKILMAVVIGALVLAGLYLLFNSVILPNLNDRIQQMFNYSG
jgi:hypothetical protein